VDECQHVAQQRTFCYRKVEAGRERGMVCENAAQRVAVIMRVFCPVR